ncbi:8-oxo-dGTP diphosphatase [Luteimicrobium subarcticum]|uniref:8-oxo-dGTP diphosphatase n=1 Tax=Luteimicrobium subarcticum TaxID=620910 RepID=A0A2M8WJB3_9MICO|nr:8-oxo-dGTP diphosphatase [Luteimicrobium subarcticum]
MAAALVDDPASPTTLLAGRRSRPVELAGRWEFPGGKVDDGETPEQALRRELVEELGVQVELFDEVTGPDDGAWPITERHVMRLWLARVVVGEPAAIEVHDEIRWLPRGHWFDVPWLDGDVPIVEALVARYP